MEWFGLGYLSSKQSREVFYEKAVLKNFAILTGKRLCWSLQKTPIQVLSCEYRKSFKTTYFEKHLLTAFE